MNFKVKLKSIKNIPKLGDIINVGTTLKDQTTKEYDKGRIGRVLDDHMAKVLGKYYNQGKGVDINLYGHAIEVKSRCEDSVSHHTIGEMSIDDVINTAWTNTSAYQKSANQLRIIYRIINDKEIQITDVTQYDFTYPHIQNMLQDSYNAIRNTLIALKLEHTVNLCFDEVAFLKAVGTYQTGPDGLKAIHIEKTNKKDLYAKFYIKITDTAMKLMERHSGTRQTFDGVFY